MRGRWIKSGPTGSELARSDRTRMARIAQGSNYKDARENCPSRFFKPVSTLTAEKPRNVSWKRARWKGAPRMALRLVGHPAAEPEI